MKAIHQDPDGVLWVGLFPRALDRLDRKTGKIIHYVPGESDGKTLGAGTNVNGIYRDPSGHLWVGGGGSGLVRLDERTGRFKHYRHDPRDPRSLISNNVYTIYGDRSGQMWVGLEGGISRFDPATDAFVNYRPIPDNPASLTNTVWIIYQDRSGALWAGTWGGVLVRFDDKATAFVSYAPDSRDPRKLNGGGINTILEDRARTLWVGTFDGLYRHDRRSGAFARYTESEGLPSSSIRCILEDRLGRLWLSTQKGVSRFDPRTETFRNYDVSDGLQSDEFSTGCFQAPDGEIFFGGSNGFNAFVPENVQDDPYVPPVVITNFTIFNEQVGIGAESVLEKAIPYVESLTLTHADNVFSFEFAALSYANSHKNRYRYRLEGFDPSWNEADSRHRLATYTNLDPGAYVFRVQGSNSDGIWNEQGVSLQIVITPPWWKTTWFRASTAALVLVLLAGAYQLRMGQVRHAFDMTLEARIGRADPDRPGAARHAPPELPWAAPALPDRLVPAARAPGRREEDAGGRDCAGGAGDHGGSGRGAGPAALGFRRNDLAVAISALGNELAAAASAHRPPTLRWPSRGTRGTCGRSFATRSTRLRRRRFGTRTGTLQAGQVEAEIRYDDKEFRLRVVTMARASTRRCSPARGSRGTMDCAACQSGPR